MKIVYLIEGMFNSAGMERVVANKANYFVRHGHSVTIITTDQKDRDDYYELDESIQRIDLHLNFSNYARYAVLFRIPVYWWKTMLFKRHLKRILQKIKPNIVDSLMLRSVDFLYKINDGSAKVMEHHFSYQYAAFFSTAFKRGRIASYIYRQRGRMTEKRLRYYDAFVVLTEEDARCWRKKLSNVEVIPNSLTFNPLQVSSAEQKVVLAIGRLEYQKGFDTLLKIWAEISARNPLWQLHIYGDGNEKETMESFIERHHLQNSVTLFPATKDIQSTFLSGSIFVLPSRFEGFPMVLLEAMACGLPAVAFACPCGPGEIITNNSDGFLIKPENSTIFAAKLEELMRQPMERMAMGAAAQQHISRFSEENVMKQWENLFVTLQNTPA